MAGGRPTKYSLELALDICKQISEGKSVRAICAQDEYPTVSTIMLWLQQHPEFSEHYVHARELQAEALADDILFISDNEQDVNRAKVQIDARKWIASKLKPKKYGNFTQVETTGKTETTHSFDAESLKQAVSDVTQLLQSLR